KSSGIKEDVIELDEKDEVDEEVVAQGNVGWPVYKYYFSSMGLVSIAMLVIASAAMVGIQVGTQLWQAHWGKSNDIAAAESVIAGMTVEPEHSIEYWIWTYFAWAISFTIMLGLVSGVALLYLSLKASRKLHSEMVGPLMRSPMSFFDVTSSGKVVNRFSHDITAVDTQLPLTFIQGMVMIFSALTIFGMCIAASYYFAIIMIPLGVAYYYLGGYFLVSN
ncbi:hypothetical protein BGX26_008857, partial [Mortierella sp. AD094]